MNIVLRPWNDDDSGLLAALMGDPRMTEFLGGPETSAQITHRHTRYVALQHSATDRMFVILLDEKSVGSIGFWQKMWQDKPILETGWSVLPFAQGQGIASQAFHVMLAELRMLHTQGEVYAFPSIHHHGSNAVSKRCGFIWQKVVDFEYPSGHMLSCNVWHYTF